ncbi:endonuclease/exonuclease/phosphatase family protein [Streptomyces cyaneofuscatus]|uniref:endonuclease/exonuclease/phosphatase family protein n=1 Tax=Streptomyces cyaneofuscatus TaxID=66883 RepID=UPI003CFA6E3B
MSTPLTVVCWNFENNGKGRPDLRAAGADLLRRLAPDIALRQELWDADAHGHKIFNEQTRALGLQGVLGAESCTAVFYNPAKFSVVRGWAQGRGPHFVLPPTALTLRYEDAGPDSLPFNAVSYHLNYASAEQRLLEAEWLTTWADKGWTTPGRSHHTLPAILAGDNNSYPTSSPGDLPLPDLNTVKNEPHRLHRSYAGPSGARLPDTRPDTAFRTAGLKDAALYWATAPHGDPSALSRTVNASHTHGPDSRVDRAYLTPELLAALTGFEVIEVDEALSDHHILRLTLNGDLLSDVLAPSMSA